MGGATDGQLYAACIEEDRVLVTLDLDFANPLRFDPAPTPGLAVLRVSDTPGIGDLEMAASRLVDVLAIEQIRGQLWVVDRSRVRLYRPPDPSPGG